MVLKSIEILHEISLTDTVLIARGRLSPTSSIQIIKTVNSTSPLEEDSLGIIQEAVQKILHEAKILARLEGQGAPAILSESTPQPLIQMEDWGGQSLDRIDRTTIDTLPQQLDIAIGMAQSLSKVHDKRVFHRNLCPEHFIASPDLKEVRIISFSNAVILGQNKFASNGSPLSHLEQLYMAPEISGRMDRTPDLRADLYSLGASLFELFTGRPPFESLDSFTLIHSHIALKPPTIREKRPTYPPILSDIVDRLLAKTPEERYQSAAAVFFDLTKLKNLLLTNKESISFRLGGRDLKDQVLTSHKLFGREALESALSAAWERVKNTQCEVLWIVGPSGIGKSSIVLDFIKRLDVTKTYIGTGKFQQFHDEFTSNSLYRSLGKIIDQILMEGSESLSLWKQIFFDAVSPHGQLLIEILPAIRHILGAQPAPSTLPEADAAERFRFVLQAFTEALGKRENPLVIFLDDLQWIDQESTKLLETIIQGFQDQKVLFIGSYRGDHHGPESEKFETTHPLIPFHSFLNAQKIPQSTHILGPLSLQDLQHLLCQTFPPRHDRDLNRLNTIADISYRRTLGNPLFVKQQILAFVEADLFWSDLDELQWTNQLNLANATNLADNIVEYILQKIDKLNANTLTVLQYASLLGSEFSLSDLALATSQFYPPLLHALEEAVACDLVTYQNSEDQTQSLPTKPLVTCVFNHDRIHQAIYLSIPIAERPHLHLAIGQRMAATIGNGQDFPEPLKHPLLMAALGHFRRAETLLTEPAQKHQIARYCLLAMKKAKLSAASKTAMEYAEFGLRLLGAEGWSKDYQLTFDLADGLHDVASLCGRFDLMDQVFINLNDHAKTLPELAHAYETKIKLLIAQRFHRKAILLALGYSKKLGVTVNPNPTLITVVVQLLLARISGLGGRLNKIMTMPPCEDTKIKAVHRVLGSVFMAAYFDDSLLCALITVKIVRLSLKYGNDTFSPQSYCQYGVILSSYLNNSQDGLKLGEIALKLVSQESFQESKDQVEFFYHGMVRHWRTPLRQCLEPIKTAGQNMLENGKTLEGHLALALHSDCCFVLGEPLPKLLQEMETQLKLAQRHRNFIVERLYLLHIQFVLNLMGRGHQCDVYRGPAINSLEAFPLYRNENDKLSLCTLTILEGFNQIIFQNYHEAYKNLTALAPYTRPLAGLYVRISYFYILTLATLGVGAKASQRDRGRYLAEARGYIKIIRSAARECPQNYNFYYELCAAEWYRLKGNFKKTTYYFKMAIRSCAQEKVGFLEALSNEYFARFWDELGDKVAAKSYFDRARSLYNSWGATEKMRHLSYPEETALDTTLPTKSASPQQELILKKPTLLGIQLDALALIQASQSLSSQIQLGDLLKKLLHLALSHSGSTQGFLALAQGDELIVKMMGKSFPAEEIIETNLSIEDYPSVSMRIVQKVVRSKKTLVLGDAYLSGGFTSDPYIKSQSVRSLLCLPILNKGDLVALLWIENISLPDVFTPEVLTFINILVAQGAISIKNAEYLLSLTEKACLEDNVSAAQAVQNSLLPLNNPPPEVSISMYYKAAEQIGGDWASYEYDPLRGRIYLCIGDVTGHGIPSALLTAAAAGAVKSILWDLLNQTSDVSMEHSLESIAHSVNRTVRDIGQPVGRSMTMVFVALDLQTGAGAFLNAGHLPIVHLSAGRSSSLAAPGVLLGFEENPEFCALPFKMSLGDRLFLYTDGLTENRDLYGKGLRFLELRKILQKHPQPSDASEKICKRIQEIWADKVPEDDCSFMILRWNHPHSEISHVTELVKTLDWEAG